MHNMWQSGETIMRSIASKAFWTVTLGAALTAGSSTAYAAACSAAFGAGFAASYACNSLGTPGGAGSPLGGITFLDPNTLLVGGTANQPGGDIRQVSVTRDAGGHIVGFGGSSTTYATAPHIDAGLTFGPGGVLFYTAWPVNQLGQIKPGSVVADRVIDLSLLSPSVSVSVGALTFVPAGFAGAGTAKMLTYDTSEWYSVAVTPDGTGTYDVSVTPGPTLSGGLEGAVYISGANPGFGGINRILVSEFDTGIVSAYEMDANGDPIVATRQEFLTGLIGAEGAVIDPLTGDFLFSTYGGGDQVVVVSVFVTTEPVPEPLTLAMLLSGLVGLGVARRRTA